MNPVAQLPKIILLTILSLYGSGIAAQIGACTDEGTKALVIKSFFDTTTGQVPIGDVGRHLLAPAVDSVLAISIEGIRTTSKDAKYRTSKCVAELIVTLNEPILKMVREHPLVVQSITNDGVAVTTSGLRTTIKYETQVTDDGKNIYASITGIEAIAAATGMAAFIIEQQKAAQLSRAKQDAVNKEAAERIAKERAAEAILLPEVKLANWIALAQKTSCVSSDDYPSAAQRNETQGTVRVLIEVSADGTVKDASVLNSSGDSREHKMLDRATLIAVKSCRYPRPPDGQVARFTVDSVWSLK